MMPKPIRMQVDANMVPDITQLRSVWIARRSLPPARTVSIQARRNRLDRPPWVRSGWRRNTHPT